MLTTKLEKEQVHLIWKTTDSSKVTASSCLEMEKNPNIWRLTLGSQLLQVSWVTFQLKGALTKNPEQGLTTTRMAMIKLLEYGRFISKSISTLFGSNGINKTRCDIDK